VATAGVAREEMEEEDPGGSDPRAPGTGSCFRFLSFFPMSGGYCGASAFRCGYFCFPLFFLLFYFRAEGGMRMLPTSPMGRQMGNGQK